ncbi:MAG: SCO family protein [Burkholderiaceae bacterium]
MDLHCQSLFRSRRWLLAMLAAAGLSLAACTEKPAAFTATDITGASFAQDFELTDTDGKTRTLADYAGKVVAVFFGFTQCPDVCPTTLIHYKAVKEALGPEHGKDLQVLFITVDPERDTNEVLAQYVPAFDPSFVGLRGSAETIKKTAREFKVFYAKVPGTTEGSYSIDHTAASYIFDKTGKIRLMVKHNAPVDATANDISQLM